jgi:photosystem II stability/assembly factor-like uncharacterized protein
MKNLRKALLVVLVCWFAARVATAQIPSSLGPHGGDVRRLAYVPDNPNRIFLGTSSGRMYVSDDAGASWSLFAHLGDGFDFVLDNIIIDPRHTETMYVAAWSIEQNTGELFRTTDGGKKWTALKGMHGKSVRSLAMATSDSKVLVAGALDGVFRSLDAGDSWTLISPPNHADIKNIQSVAIDPKDTATVYAGTWHLAWKTTDAGAAWHQINRGMIDDSDVFSIIVDRTQPNVVYASACSGIYKSEAAGELFSKVQGIPFSARRTRVLKQDPNIANIVYAGTTEGLWRTVNAGKTWQRISAANLIINDVQVDPRDSNKILLATDRSGVMVSADNGKTFAQSNTGFTHRQVTSVVVDAKNPQLLYAGIVNDKEYGGVFTSKDAGQHWNQFSAGLGSEDVFTLLQDKKGSLYAGTNRGLFRFSEKTRIWMRVFPAQRSQSFQVNTQYIEGKHWIVAGPQGIAHSHNNGVTWATMRNPSKQAFIAVRASHHSIVAATHDMLFSSSDDGATWTRMTLPSVSYVRSMVVDGNDRIWIATPQGAFLRDSGGSWTHARDLGAAPTSLAYDDRAAQVLALTAANDVFATSDGESWQRVVHLGIPARTLVPSNNGIYAGTLFDGVLSLQRPRSKEVVGGGGSR